MRHRSILEPIYPPKQDLAGMGDDATADPDLAPSSSRKRPRSGDLKKAAEIVMVLSVMGRMRGGRDPTPAEREMVAEARGLLAGVCERVKPKDLFSSDAVRVVIDELGINPSQDALRPPKMSIGEKVLHTKKKMEESKELATVYSSQPLPAGVGSNSDPHGTMLHGAPRFLPDRPNMMQPTTAIYQSSSPVVHASELDLTIPSLKQPQNETQPAVTLIKSSISSLGRDSLSHTETAQFRLDARATQPQVPASAGYAATEYPIVPVQLTPAATMKLEQTNKLLYHTQMKPDGAHATNSVQSSYQVVKSQDTQSSFIEATSGNQLTGHQPPQAVTYVHATTLFTNHNDIANSILGILQQQHSDHSHWTPPSIDYINKPINCQICKITINDVDSLVVCDACEKGSHLRCLQSSNKGISKTTEWHCPRCLLGSNGKPLPPKYGRVTRSSSTQKASVNTVKTSMPCEKRADNAESKINHHKLLPNGNCGLSNLAHGSKLACASSVSSDSKATTAEGMQFSNVHDADIKLEDGKCTGTPTYQFKEADGVVCATSGKQIENSHRRNSGLPLQDLQKAESLLGPKIESKKSFSEHHRVIAEETDQFQEPDGTGTQTENSDRSDGELSLQDLRTSTSELLFNPKIVPEFFSSEQQSNNSKITNQIQIPDGSNTCNRMEANVEISANQLDEICEPTSVELKPCKRKESVDNQTDCDAGHDQVIPSSTSNGTLCVGDAAMDFKSPSLLEFHPMHWVGDVLETVEERVHYGSCHVNGALHNLQDHVLISCKDMGLFPSKLQSLWEDKKTGSRWASVGPYYFLKDLPGAVNPPSTPENREVYASKNGSTILASSISGPCEVLPTEKFQEETDRRTHLGDTSGLGPLFLCKWLYDESKDSFQSITS